MNTGGFGSPWADSQAGANNHRGGKLTQSSVDEEGGEVADLKDENNMPTPTPTHPVQSRVVHSCFEKASHTSCTARQTTVVMRNKHFTALMATPKPGLMTAAKPRWLHRLRTETTTKWMRGARLVMQRINLFCLDFESAKMRENGSVCNDRELN